MRQRGGRRGRAGWSAMSRRRIHATSSGDLLNEFVDYAGEVRALPVAERLDLATLGERFQLQLTHDGELWSFGLRDEVSLSSLKDAALTIRQVLPPGGIVKTCGSACHATC